MFSYQLRIANSLDDVKAAQKLRYKVFVQELSGNGDLVDHAAGLECDRYDAFAEHLVLVDPERPIGDHVVGVYRLMDMAAAERAGQFYAADEFDLSPILGSGRKALELGRSCLHPDHRGGAAMYQLWHGLSQYVLDHQIEVLFGTASFHGTDLAKLAQPLSLLHHRHLAPAHLRPQVREKNGFDMNILPEGDIDRRAAMLQTPALIKAYLRLGGCVGQGAYVDHDFNTTDVMLVLDIAQMNTRQRNIYSQKGRL